MALDKVLQAACLQLGEPSLFLNNLLHFGEICKELREIFFERLCDQARLVFNLAERVI